MPTSTQIGIHPVLNRSEPQLLQPRGLHLGERRVDEVDERTPTPQRQRLAERGGGGIDAAGAEQAAALGRERSEAVGVDVAGIDLEGVARTPGACS